MPVVTLTSDIGTRDYFIGAVKGRLLRNIPDLQIVDITHGIMPFNHNEGAYFMRSACRHFPDFTWHIALINIYHTKNPGYLVAHSDNMYYVCPNNGLLPMIFDRRPLDIIKRDIPASAPGDFFKWVDEIADMIKRVDNGEAFHTMGEEPEEIVEHSNMKPTYGTNWIDGQIIFVDGFENVVVNITRKDFDEIGKGREFEIGILANQKIKRLSSHYGEVNQGDKLAFFNSAGFLEIAINQGNAAGLFGLQAVDGKMNSALAKARSVYTKVRILFLP